MPAGSFFSEADRLPGVIADRYNDLVILQLLTQARHRTMCVPS